MKKRSSTPIGWLALVALALSACIGIVGEAKGSGNVVTELRDVSDFNRVYLNCSGDAVITQNGEQSVTIETDDNILEYITTEVRDGTLYLDIDTTKIKTVSPTRLQFEVNVADLDAVTVAASGDISAASLDVDSLVVKTSASGHIRIDSLMAEEVDMRLGGSGDVALMGEVPNQEVLITGSGGVLAEDLKSDTVKIRISGSGDATVWAIESLNVNLGSSGSVSYYGDPVTGFEDNGSGEIISLGEK